jgi:Tol biopolymer transport system component
VVKRMFSKVMLMGRIATFSVGLAVVLAALLAALALAPIASAQTVGTTSFPGTPGAIAFVSERDGADNFDVYRMNADGFGQTRLTDTSGVNLSPSWSADGAKISFTNAAAFGAPGEVFQMGADGSNETNLTNAPSNDGASSYSPTSGKFTFVSTRVGSQSDIYLTTLTPDGQTTGLTRLTTSDAQDIGPAISPDGRRIAFMSDRDGDFDIYVMKLAQEGAKNVPLRLTKNAVFDFTPDWSPDGTQIAFSSDRGSNREVYRMKASPEGRLNKPVNLSNTPTASDQDPTWSPDGKKIAFVTDRDGNQEIYRMRATDGANQVNLTNNPALDFQPAWQPLP